MLEQYAEKIQFKGGKVMLSGVGEATRTAITDAEAWLDRITTSDADVVN